jgi:thioredoxin reductase
MNNELYVDHLVIGLSISGIAAAIELASQGRSVCIVEHWPDTASLSGSAFIFSTPLNQRKLVGEEFEEIALRLLDQSNVIVSMGLLSPLCLKEHKNQTFFYFFDEISQKSVFAASTIFAPNGTEIGLPDKLVPKSFFGKGVSYDAWSDGRFYINKPVVIIGCGNRAIEQAYWAEKWASFVYLVCENDTLKVSSSWMEIVAEFTTLKMGVGIRFNSITYDENGCVKGIILSGEGKKDSEKTTSAIFVARELVCDWSIWGGEQRAKSYIEKRMLYVCGLATGIDYSRHAELFQDGLYAAKKCLQLA